MTDLAVGESVSGTLQVFEPDETTLLLNVAVMLTRGKLYTVH